MQIIVPVLFVFCFAALTAADPSKEPGKSPASGSDGKPVVEEKRFDKDDHVTEKSLEFDSGKKDLITWRFNEFSDSGVELERTLNGETLWRVHVRSLRVEHSLYHHEATVVVEEGKVVVTSVGFGTIHEVRDLKTGRQLSRKIESGRKHDPREKPVIEGRWLAPADGYALKGEYFEIDDLGEDRVSFRYRPVSDSGVELERTVNNKVLWRVHLQPFGGKQSKFHQGVTAFLSGSRVIVILTGATTIDESRDLDTGWQLSREVRKE